MISKNHIKYLTSLKEKKYRDLYSEYIVEGIRSVDEFLLYPDKIKSIFALPEWIEKHNTQIQNITDVYEINNDVIHKISCLKTPNQVVALIKKNNDKVEINFQDIILVLDNIGDPGNIGTIIRIADWFGIDYIICSPDTVDPYNPKAVQASMGSICRVNIIVKPLEKFFNIVPTDIPIYGTCIDTENMNFSVSNNKAVIVIGNEAKGISDNISKYVTQKISIPSYPHLNSVKGKADSLNVAIATSILCYEFRKSLLKL